jgi:hypothetical protein
VRLLADRLEHLADDALLQGMTPKD